MDKPAIADLPQLVDQLPANMRSRFERIFHVAAAEGEIVPPEAMAPWLEKHFGSVDAVRRQRIVRVTNRVTLEGTLFNALRARRPVEDGSGDSRDGTELDKMIRDNLGDPFCRPLDGTPADVFGRIRGQYSLSASNVAKYDAWHGVLIFDEHHPLRFDADQVADYVDTAQEWVQTAHSRDPEARYPFFLWNCLWRSGASILHGHAQMVLARGMHLAKAEAWRQAAARYRAAHGTGYFDDLADVMRALGLATDVGSAVVFPTLTPIKEKETHIIAPRLDAGLKAALFHVLRALIDRMGTTSFNVGIYQPPLGPTDEDWAGFPILARVIDRGAPGSRASDMGAMELFAASVVTTDPFRVADELRAERFV